MNKLIADLELITLAAIEGGALARGYLAAGFTREANKTEGDPWVTNADRAIDARLKEILTAARPDYGWLSEETAADLSQLAREYVFVVDPIDGTRAFVNSGDNFGVSVGLLHKGQPILGAVYRPVEHQLITGGQGLGVFVDGQPAQRQPHMGKPRLLAGYREQAKGRFDRFSEDFEIIVEGSIAYRYAMVGAGLAEAAVSYHEMSLWDTCAGHAIARAGGAEAFIIASDESYNYRGPNLVLPAGTMCTLVENKDAWRQVFNHPVTSTKL
jgi:myo-inositol-1(or 4)-monophosphatase